MKVFIWLGLGLVLCSIILEPSYILNVLSVFLLIFFCIYLMNKYHDFSSITFFFFYGYITTSIICCIAEFGGFFAEIQSTSYLTGATTRNSCLAFFTLYFAVISFTFFSRYSFKLSYFPQNILYLEGKLVELIYIFIIIVLFGIYFKYGHPNDYGLDRFGYWNTVAPEWGGWLKNLSELFMPFLGFKYVKTDKKYYLFLFFIGLFSYYLVGDKFTAFVGCFVLFFIPYFLFSDGSFIKKIFNIKSIVIIFFCILILLYIIYLSYLSIAQGDNSRALESIYIRFLLQAQMWWSVDQISDFYPKSIEMIWNNYIGLFQDDGKRGIYYLMSLVAPSSLFHMMLENNITFTMAYPADNIYFFGYPLAIVSVSAWGIILGGGLSLFKVAFRTHSAVFIIFIGYVYHVLVRIVLMGQVYYVTSIKFILSLIIIFLYIALSKGFTRRRS